jgi:hypothetical protein
MKHIFQKVSGFNHELNAQIRIANRREFAKIPDIIEVERILGRGRHKTGKYTDNFMGSLAKYYDSHGYLTSPETGSSGVGQLGKLREIIAQGTEQKSSYFGIKGRNYLIEAHCEHIVKSLVILKTKDEKYLTYSGNKVNEFQKGKNYRFQAKIKEHYNWQGRNQSSITQVNNLAPTGLLLNSREVI